jgi:hypothetical protein
MMKTNLVFLTVLLSISMLSCTQTTKKKTTSKAEEHKINTLSLDEKGAGWELLFNGKNLDGWKKFNGGEVTGWIVKDGILNNSGIGSDHGGDIISKRQEFKDFELYLEWNSNPNSNSGIFYHAKEGIVDKIYQAAPEYQLIDDGGFDGKIHADQHSGACYAMYPPLGDAVKPAGEWNAARIIVKGTHVEHHLNGKKVVEYDFFTDDWKDCKANSKWKDEEHYGMEKSGGIGLQDHGGLTRYRNIKIRKL